jgi:L-ascorbate metabolism protein UlaG (beta-lactamase superfamily)
VRLTHVGGPTTLVEVDGWRILIDPTFDPPGRRYGFGWGSSSTKLVGPAVEPADLGPVDVVLLTHDHHADNLDDAGRALLPDVPVVVTTVPGAERLGGGARGLAPWASTTVSADDRPDLVVTATPCRHGPPLSKPIVGDVIGFAIERTGRPGTVWCSGDTVLYRGLDEVVDRLDVDVAILHLGSVRFPITGPLRYTMTIGDAIDLCDRLRPRVAVPVHYDGWSHFHEGLAAIERRLAAEPSERVAAFRVVPEGVPVEL